MEEQTTKKPRGFAAMSPEARAAISSKGGVAAHAKGVAHEFSSDEARAAAKRATAKRSSKKS